MSSRRPGEGRYAHVEREQRWMVRAAPADAQRVASIVDWYIRGTRLRLRRTEGDEGVVYKLGQKVRVEPSGAGENTKASGFRADPRLEQRCSHSSRCWFSRSSVWGSSATFRRCPVLVSFSLIPALVCALLR